MKILKEYYDLVDKSAWPKGEWSLEPDIVNLKDDSGLFCRIIRNHMGNLCGYVILPPSNKHYLIQYDLIPIDVHGGLTWGELANKNSLNGNFCPVLYENDPGLPYYIGFDTSHGGDLMPCMLAHFTGFKGDTYKNINFVINELKELCKQL